MFLSELVLGLLPTRSVEIDGLLRWSFSRVSPRTRERGKGLQRKQSTVVRSESDTLHKEAKKTHFSCVNSLGQPKGIDPFRKCWKDKVKEKVCLFTQKGGERK